MLQPRFFICCCHSRVPLPWVKSLSGVPGYGGALPLGVLGAAGPEVTVPPALRMTSSMGKLLPQSLWLPPQLPRSRCWHTPRPEPCASPLDSFLIGMPYCLASSAIHLAQLLSISRCWFSHSLRDQLMNPHSSMLTATGL